MSKYTRLNKINHYHDSGSRKANLEESTSREDRPAPLYGNDINQARAKMQQRATTNTNNYITGGNTSRNDNNCTTITAMRPSQFSCNNCNKSSRLAFIALCVAMMMLLVLLISVDGVYSLNCYHCSSVDNPGCDESFTGMANITETNCEKHINQPAKVCRKIVQFIEKKKVVIRSCGFVDEHADKEHKPMCHKRSGTFAIMMESCSCYTDNCNHSASLVPNQSVLTLASSSLVVLFFYYLLQQHVVVNNQSATSRLISSERQR